MRRFFNSYLDGSYTSRSKSLKISKGGSVLADLFEEQAGDEYSFEVTFDEYTGKSAPCWLRGENK